MKRHKVYVEHVILDNPVQIKNHLAQHADVIYKFKLTDEKLSVYYKVPQYHTTESPFLWFVCKRQVKIGEKRYMLNISRVPGEDGRSQLDKVLDWLDFEIEERLALWSKCVKAKQKILDIVSGLRIDLKVGMRVGHHGDYSVVTEPGKKRGKYYMHKTRPVGEIIHV